MQIRQRWSPLQDAIQSVEQLLAVLLAPCTQWEYANYNSSHWPLCPELTCAELEGAALFGRKRVKVETQAGEEYWADLDQMKMNKLNPGAVRSLLRLLHLSWVAWHTAAEGLLTIASQGWATSRAVSNGLCESVTFRRGLY